MEQQRNRSVDARSPIDQNMFADLFVENQIEPVNECDVDELLLEGKSAKTSDDEKRTKKRGVSESLKASAIRNERRRRRRRFRKFRKLTIIRIIRIWYRLRAMEYKSARLRIAKARVERRIN